MCPCWIKIIISLKICSGLPISSTFVTTTKIIGEITISVFLLQNFIQILFNSMLQKRFFVIVSEILFLDQIHFFQCMNASRFA